MIWKILEMEQTKDEEKIKTAYRNKLRFVNPEDDQEGFKELRRAYEEALQYASQEEIREEENGQSDTLSSKKNEVDLWIDRIDTVYQDVKTRRQEESWSRLLHDAVCDDLDMELEAADKLLIYFMSHSFMPQPIWQLVDKRFHYMDDYDQLKERFPENYLEYIKWQIETPNFIDFALFDGKTDSHVDDYINKLYETIKALEDKNLKKVRQLLKELSRFDITHPFTQVEEARYLLMKQEEEGGDYAKEALSIMEELDFEYSDNLYIERVYAETLIENGEVTKALAVYDALLEKAENHHNGLLGRANCIFLLGDAEKAKELIEDILEERVQDTESLALLEKVNVKLVEDYEAALNEKMDRETGFKLGWCYYQQKEFEKGIALLDRLGEGEDYDYINLRCRLYLANENYEQAYPLAMKWLTLIEESEDDGSKEMQKRKNRLSLAHFSIGICTWETLYKQAEEEKKKELFLASSDYIRQAVSEESNVLVKLSYMEQLARLCLEEKEYKECIAICNEILQKDRGFFPAYVHRQKANYELKNAKEVIDDYFECIDIYPEYAPPYIFAAEVFFAFDQYDDVEQVIETASKAGIESDSLELYRIKCIHYKNFSDENTKKALEAMEALRIKIEERRSDEETDLEDMAALEKEYALLFWDIDDTDKTLEVIEQFLRRHRNHPVMLHLKVDVLNSCERFKEALEVCQVLVKKEPDDPYTKAKLGGCLERTRDLNKAIKCYKDILNGIPDFVPALRRLMYIYSFLSNHQNNLKLCKQGIHYATRLIDATGSAEGYVERGNLYIDLYELDRAVSDCRKAIEMDEQSYYAYNNLGCALLKLRRVEEAIVPLEQVIRMEPDREHLPYLNLAECYLLKKEYDKAIRAYENVLRLRPEETRYKEEIAKVYIRKQEYEKAVQIYKELVETAKKQITQLRLQSKQKSLMDGALAVKGDKLALLCYELANVYRLAGEPEQEKQYLKKMKKYLGYAKECADAPVKGIKTLAEYYRDHGDLKKAGKLIRHICKKHNCKEDTRKQEYAQLYFVYATVLFEQNRREEAAKYAVLYLKDWIKRNEGEKNLLSDRRYRAKYLYDLAFMSIISANLDAAKKYLKKIPECHLCVDCGAGGCYEYYFAMGLIAEMEGRKEEAAQLYEKAIEIKGDYPYAKMHLEKIKEV